MPRVTASVKLDVTTVSPAPGQPVVVTTALSTPAPADRPLRELRGVVERITYQNAENGYAVARLAPERPESEARSPSAPSPARHRSWPSAWPREQVPLPRPRLTLLCPCLDGR